MECGTSFVIVIGSIAGVLFFGALVWMLFFATPLENNDGLTDGEKPKARKWLGSLFKNKEGG